MNLVSSLFVPCSAFTAYLEKRCKTVTCNAHCGWYKRRNAQIFLGNFTRERHLELLERVERRPQQ